MKEIFGSTLGNRDTDVKKYHKAEKNWKMELKAIKKQNKMIFSMAKRLGSCRELKKIHTKANKQIHSISNISSCYYDYYLSSDSDW